MLYILDEKNLVLKCEKHQKNLHSTFFKQCILKKLTLIPQLQYHNIPYLDVHVSLSLSLSTDYFSAE